MKRSSYLKRKTKLAKKRKVRSQREILRDKAWDVFSLYIRTKANFTCYTCPAKGGITNAGHFWHGVLDFDEENIKCQCVRCNKWLSGNLAVYGAKLLNEIGEERFKALDIRHTMAMKGEKHDESYYQEIIDKYSL